MPFYIGLLHYPVYNKRGETIASAITDLDLHDIARLAKTYGAKKFYVINPLADQQDLANDIRRHWVSGHGAQYNKDRQEAMTLVSIVPALEAAIAEIKKRDGVTPLLVATDAGTAKKKKIDYLAAKKIVALDRPALILFGTAWGMSDSVINKADYLLEPVFGITQYNHLSVRTAAAIIIDRLFSQFTKP